jgi:protein-disulfide isomerase
MALGQKVGVGGTPTIYINGRLYNGERTAEDMIKVIDQKLLGKK